MLKPLTVVQFTNSVARGGVEEHILTLLRALNREQFRLIFVCPPVLAEKVRHDVPSDVELIPLCLRKPGQLAEAFHLARLLRERRVDVLHSHLFYGSVFASPVGWLCRVPVIVETPHVREHWRKGWLKSRFFVDRWIGRTVDHYIAVSHANAAYLREQKGLPARKISVIQNGCDRRRFLPNGAPALSRRSLGFNEGDPVLVLLGRLEPQKGHAVLLEALPAIRTAFPAVRLVCVGDGALRGDLERQVAERGLRDHVRFTGFQGDVAGWLQLADLTVLPSFYEGLPLAAIESLGAGRPVVATEVDGTPEVVRHGETGLVVPAGDPARLAEAVCRLLADPALRLAMGRRGQQWVLEHFTFEQQVTRTEELYLRLWEEWRRLRRPRQVTEAEAGACHARTP